jgi:hypothetical protein
MDNSNTVKLNTLYDGQRNASTNDNLLLLNVEYDNQRTLQDDPFITCQSSSLWMLLKYIYPEAQLSVNDVIHWFDKDKSKEIYNNLMKKGILASWANSYRKRELWRMLQECGNNILNGPQTPFTSNLKFAFESYLTVNKLMSKVEESIRNGFPVMIGFNSHLNGGAFHHIFNVVGFNQSCFICHDPYGNWSKRYIEKNANDAGKYINYLKSNLAQHINKHGLFIR